RLRCRLGERDAFRSGIENNQDNRRVSGHSTMHCSYSFWHHLTCGEMLLLATVFFLYRQLSRYDVAGIWKWMCMPFQLRMCRDRDLEYGELRLSGWVAFVWSTIP